MKPLALCSSPLWANLVLIYAICQTWNTKDKITFKNWECNNLFKNRKQDGNSGIAIFVRPGNKVVARKDCDTENIEIV